MTRAAFQELRKGEEFQPYADEWNAFIEAAVGEQVFEGEQQDFKRWQLCKNGTGSVINRFDCAAVTTPVILPSANEDVFPRLVMNTATANFDDHSARFVVAAHDVAVDEIGRFYRMPWIPAKVDISHDWHGFCDSPMSAISNLESMPHGSAEILWSASATGTGVFCVVRPGPRRNCHVWGKPTSDVAPGATFTMGVADDGGAITGYTVSVDSSRLHTKAPDIDTDDWCRAEWSLFDKKWHLVNAECPE